MSSATQGIAAMQAVFAICSSVASGATPPTDIVFDPNVQAFYSLAPAQASNPQFFLAVTDLAGVKQEPRYIGAGRTETFSVSGVVWGAIANQEASSIESLTTFLAQLLTSLDAGINADPTLGGIAIQSWIEGYELTFDQELQGRAAQIDFEIHVESIIT